MNTVLKQWIKDKGLVPKFGILIDFYRHLQAHPELLREDGEKEIQYLAPSWQKCPICDGQGIVSKPSYVPNGVENWSSTTVNHTCHHCHGQKVVSVINGLPMNPVPSSNHR